jgi:hypothetical protein
MRPKLWDRLPEPWWKMLLTSATSRSGGLRAVVVVSDRNQVGWLTTLGGEPCSRKRNTGVSAGPKVWRRSR